MNDEWKSFKVSVLEEQELLLVEDGNHGEYRPRSTEFGIGDTAFIRASDMVNGRIAFDSAARINDTALARIRKGVGRGGDVLLSSKGTVGKLAFAPLDAPPFVCSPQTTFWRTLSNDSIDRRYLFYFMCSRAFEDQWMARKGETDMADYISLTAQREFDVVVPTIGVQRAIARILGALDDKIELNRKMNQTLEAMAQSLFKSWFVDFDPVVAKLEGRIPFGMDAETAALFPDKLVESEIGPVPEGWNVMPVSRAIKVNPRRVLPGGSEAKYLDMQSMPTTSAIPESWIVRRAGSGMRFMNGDTLVARITPCLENGKTAFINFLDGDEVGWGSTEYIVLRSDVELPQSYSYFLARTDEFRNHAISNMTGSSGRQRVPSSSLDKLILAFPPKPIADKFGIHGDKVLAVMRSNQNQSQVLTAIRDTLLPKLLSGELRVKEAEKVADRTI